MRSLAALLLPLGTLIGGGLGPAAALELIAAEPGDRALARLARGVRAALEPGAPLSSALARGGVDRLVVAIVRAGEAQGRAPLALARAAAHVERVAEMRAAVRAATWTPLAMGGVALAIIALALGALAPPLQMIYDAMGLHGTPDARALLGAGAWLSDYWVIPAGALYPLYLAGRAVWRSRAGRALAGTLRVLPWVGPLWRAISLAAFARALGAALEAGVPLLDALDRAADATDCPVYRRAIDAALPRVRDGATLAAAMAPERVCGGALIALLDGGEAHGNLPDLVVRAAQMTDRVLGRRLRSLAQVTEPTVVIGSVFLIGWLIQALFMPLVCVHRCHFG